MNGVYNEDLTKAQDYELWARGANNSYYENIQEVLIEYSIATKKQFSTIKKEIIVRTRCAYKYNYLVPSLFYSAHMLLYYGINYILSIFLNNKRSISPG